MRTRGRHSAAENTVIITGAFGQRPDPPAELTPRQAELWREIVASEDPKFFDTGALRGLLASYCQHREAAEKINEVINSFDALWLRNGEAVKRYQTLLRMRDLEARGAAGMATKLRLTNQARYTPHGAASAARTAAKGPKPWEAAS